MYMPLRRLRSLDYAQSGLEHSGMGDIVSVER